MKLFGRTIFPMLPPYGAHDDNDAPPPYTDPDRPTPYLGLKARISQIWINRWTILILLVLVRVLLAATSMNNDMNNAQRQALSACNSVQSVGSAMASMPHYMAEGVNVLVSDGVSTAVNALVDVLLLMVTGVEALVVFYIDFLTQMYLCLFTLVVRGAAEAALSLADDAFTWLNKELTNIEGDISNGVTDLQDTLNTLSSALNTVKSKCNSVFPNSLCSDIPSVPTVNFTSQINDLQNLTNIPDVIFTDINNINSSIPTFKQVQNMTKEAIELPFELVKTLISQNLGNYSFDNSNLPVPAKVSLSFCGENDGINEFFDKVVNIIVLARKIFIGVLAAAAILACLPMGYIELRRWKTAKDRAKMVATTHDSLDVVYLVSRPHTSSLGMKAATFFNNSRHQILVRWVVAYATSIPALVLLGLGLAGLFSCLCQYILLKAVEKEVPELTAEVTQFADKVVGALQNASAQWADDTNQIINSTNTAINDNLFGWVNKSTTALNTTLNTFLEQSNDVINTTFGGTVLYSAVTGIFDCVVELKVESVQKGLTWVHDNAHINIPTISNNTFSAGTASSITSNDSFLSDSTSATSNEITAIVNDVTTMIQEGINTEAKISAALVLLWLLLVLMGCIRALTFCCKRDRARGNGGGQAEVVAGPTEIIDPPNMAGGVAAHATSASFASRAVRPEYTRNEPGPNFATTTTTTTTRTTTAAAAVSRAAGEANRKDPFQETEYEYEDQKFGFAGERNYSSAMQMDDPTHKSAYVEFGGDEKRR